MFDLSSRILSFEELSIELTKIVDEFKNEIWLEKARSLCEQLRLFLLKSNDYYYLSYHDGISTGWYWHLRDLHVLSNFMIAYIKDNTEFEKLEKNRNEIIEVLDQMIREIELYRRPINDRSEINLISFTDDWATGSKIFVSYSHRDDISDLITIALRRRLISGMTIWIDKYDLKRYHQIPQELSNAIQNSDASIIIASKNFLESKWCNQEWYTLFTNRVKDSNYRIYVIRIDDVEFPPFMNTFYYTDCRGYDRPEAKIELAKLMIDIEDYDRNKEWESHRIESIDRDKINKVIKDLEIQKCQIVSMLNQLTSPNLSNSSFTENRDDLLKLKLKTYRAIREAYFNITSLEGVFRLEVPLQEKCRDAIKTIELALESLYKEYVA